MLYTSKGDDGKTKIFRCNQKFSKSSAVTEALGALDEVNSYLGLCKVKEFPQGLALDFQKGKALRGNVSLEKIIHSVQENLFIIQAQIAGAGKKIDSQKIENTEKIIGQIEKELPPVKSFFISGGTELAASLDFARTLARRAERRVVQVFDEGEIKIQKETLAYLNRLSSLLYALARFSNYKMGVVESAPHYK